ncbi:MAG: methyl-accepting chemotaxis protein [Desulfobulbus sp.]|jgi:methyl-accepting chemotaxis protein
MLNSIKTKLLIAFFATITVTIFFLCLIAGFNIRKNEVESFYRSASEEISLINNAVDIFFKSAKANIQFLAASSIVQEADESILSYVNAKEATNDKGVLSPVEQRMTDLFVGLQTSHPDYAEVYTGTRWGGFATSSSTMPGGFDPRVRPWYKKAMDLPGQIVMSPAYLSYTGSPVVACATTVRDKAQQNIIGVAAVDLSLATLTELIKKTPIGKTGYVIMVQDDGTILAHPRHDDLNMKKLAESGVPALAELDAITTGRAQVSMDDTQWYAQVHTIDGLGWKLIGVIEKAEVMERFYSLVKTMLLAGFLLLLAMSAATAFFATRLIRPVIDITTAVKNIKGDLTRRVPVVTNDEIGELAKWFNVFLEQQERIIGELGARAAILQQTSHTLDTQSKQLNSGATDTATRSKQVHEGAHHMNTNMHSVAAASEQAATNVNAVAAAMEEMSATVREIASNSETARGIAHKASTEANSTAERVNLLGNAVNEIGKVTEVITEISEQTNLLALNATIEAARAGESGKGFAVVANEIKELARQTAEATGDIKDKIEAIQSTTSDAVTEINRIAGIIGEVNEIVTAIASAVEEQSAASSEIASNLHQASLGIQEVNEHVAETTTITGSISSDIAEVSTSARQMNIATMEVNTQIEALAELSGRLMQIVEQFTTTPPRFDFAKVRSAHMQWYTRVVTAFNINKEEIRADSVVSDHECDFGKWLFGPEAKSLESNPHYSKLTALHKTFHEHTKAIFQLLHEGQRTKATERLHEFEKNREELLRELDAFYLESRGTK